MHAAEGIVVTSIRPARLARRLALSGAALTLAVTTAACGSASAGAAAVVDGQRISVSDVQQATQDIQAFAGQQVQQSQVLYFLIIGPSLVKAAAQAGVGVSPDDARTQLVTKVAEPSDAAVAAIQANEALSRLTSLPEDKSKPIMDSLIKQIGAADIEVNPRYGGFDSKQVIMVPAEQNWLVPPAAPSGESSPASSPAPSAS